MVVELHIQFHTDCALCYSFTCRQVGLLLSYIYNGQLVSVDEDVQLEMFEILSIYPSPQASIKGLVYITLLFCSLFIYILTVVVCIA